MIKMLVLKYPNVDVIADLDKTNPSEAVNASNIFIVTWVNEFCKFIPFTPAKDLSIVIPLENIAMEFEVSDDMEKLYRKHTEAYYKNRNDYKLMDKEEYEKYVRERQEKANEVLNKKK